MEKVQLLILGALFTGMLSHLNAEESIDHQIAEIQKASSAERVQLMNRFKQNVANMNEEDQMKAMTRIRERFQNQAQNKADLSSQRIQEAQKNIHQTNPHQQHNTMQMQNMHMKGTMQGGKR